MRADDWRCRMNIRSFIITNWTMAMQLKVNDNAFRIFYDEIHFIEETLLSCLNRYKSKNLFYYHYLRQMIRFLSDFIMLVFIKISVSFVSVNSLAVSCILSILLLLSPALHQHRCIGWVGEGRNLTQFLLTSHNYESTLSYILWISNISTPLYKIMN